MDSNDVERVKPRFRWPMPPHVAHDSSQLPFVYAQGEAEVFSVKDLSVKLLAPSGNWIQCAGDLWLQADGTLLIRLVFDEPFHFHPKAPMYDSFNVLRGAGVYGESPQSTQMRIFIQDLVSFTFTVKGNQAQAICTYRVSFAFAGPNASPAGAGRVVVPLINFHAFLGEGVLYPDRGEASATMQFTVGGRDCRLFVDRKSLSGPGKNTGFCVGHLEYDVAHLDEHKERDFLSKLTLLLSISTGRWVEWGALILMESQALILRGSHPGPGKATYFPIGGVGKCDDLRVFLERSWVNTPSHEKASIRLIVRYMCYMLSVNVVEVGILIASALLETLKFHYAAMVAIERGTVKSADEYAAKIVLGKLQSPPLSLLYQSWPTENLKPHKRRRSSGAPKQPYASLASTLGLEVNPLKLKLFQKVYRNTIVHAGRIPNFQDSELKVIEYSVDFAVRAILRWVGYEGHYNKYPTLEDGNC